MQLSAAALTNRRRAAACEMGGGRLAIHEYSTALLALQNWPFLRDVWTKALLIGTGSQHGLHRETGTSQPIIANQSADRTCASQSEQ